MPCERKHVEAIRKAVEGYVPTKPCPVCDDFRNLNKLIHAAIAACDDSHTAAERAVERIREWGEQLITNYTHDDELNTIGATMLSIINEEEAR